MIYYDEERKVGGEDILIKKAKRIRNINLKDAFKLFVISKFLERPVTILVREKISEIRYRYGIPVVSERCFKKFKDLAFLFKGGRYYKIDPEKILKKISERHISIGEFCRRVGISRRNFYNYLKGQMVHEDNYKKIEEFFGDVREKRASEILKVREFRFKIEFDKKVLRAYELIRDKVESYILSNEYVDLCVKGSKRVVVKIGSKDKIEEVVKELKSEPFIIKSPDEIKLVIKYQTNRVSYSQRDDITCKS